MTASPSSGSPTRQMGLSLSKLVQGLPESSRLRQPADALIVIGRQLELIVQEDQLPADVALGILRFSLFRLHQGRIAQLAQSCRQVTVYGEADMEPPTIPGVTFVPLPAGTPLTQEWFLVVDSPRFWGALLTQAVPERANGNMRRYLFEGALTSSSRVISRALLLLNLVQSRPSAAPAADHERDEAANLAHWARLAYALGTHSEAERLKLAASLGDFPAWQAVLAARTQPHDRLFDLALHGLTAEGAAGCAIYRSDSAQLQPVAWDGIGRPPPLGRDGGLAGQALQQGTPLLAHLAPQSAEQATFPEAQSAVFVPLVAGRRLWGVLAAGTSEAEASDSAAFPATVGMARLLEQILDAGDTSGSLGMFAPSNLLDQSPAPSNNGRSWGDTPAAPAAPANIGRSWGDTPTTPADNGRSWDIPAAPPAPAAPANTGRSWGDTPAAPAAPANTGRSWGDTPAAPADTGRSWGDTPAAPAAPPPAAPPPAAQPPAISGSVGLPAWMRVGVTALNTNQVQPQAAAPQPTADTQNNRSWAMLQKRMVGALVAFDQRAAEQVWSEACSMYATEAICTELLMPVQIAVGEGWHRGEVTVAAEHFASRFVQGKLLSLLNSHVDNHGGPLAVIGCAQGEMHEIGAVMLSLFMRWSGFRVIYLGQNVPNTTIAETIRQLRPQVLGLSATTVEGAHNLTETGQIISQIEQPRPLFIFGGMAFYERPDLRSRIRGQFLEGDIRQMVRQLAEQLRK